MKKIRVVHITKNFCVTGISNVVMNYCQYIDKDKFDLTVITSMPAEKDYLNFLKKNNVNVIIIPHKKKHPVKYYFSLMKELSHKRYDIAHIHGNSSTLTAELLISAIKGIKIRIMHCHSAKCDHMKLHKILRPLLNKLCTYGLACSSLAANFCFDKNNTNYQIVCNAFNIEKFKFDIDMRNTIRKQLGISDNEILIGHIGTFEKVKNHPFLIDVFFQLVNNDQKYKLLLIGDGIDFNMISSKIENSKHKENVILYGKSKEIEKMYNAMDIFVLPSLYEGLGIVLIEAQINGLPVIASDVIPKEAMVSKSVTLLPLDSQRNWVEAMKNADNKNRVNTLDEKLISNFDINKVIKQLECIYIKLKDNTRNKPNDKIGVKI